MLAISHLHRGHQPRLQVVVRLPRLPQLRRRVVALARRVVALLLGDIVTRLGSRQERTPLSRAVSKPLVQRRPVSEA